MNNFVQRFQEMGASVFMEYVQLTLARPLLRALRPRLISLDEGHVEFEVVGDETNATERGAGPFEDGILSTSAQLAAELVMLSTQQRGQTFKMEGMSIEYLGTTQHQVFVVADLVAGQQSAEGPRSISVAMTNVSGEIVCTATVTAALLNN